MILTDQQLADKNRDIYERTQEISLLTARARTWMYRSERSNDPELFTLTYSDLQDLLTAARAAMTLMDQIHEHRLGLSEGMSV